MSAPRPNNGQEAPLNQPPLLRDAQGRVDVDSVPDVIQWFLDYDSRVALIKHPKVEEVFQWKQEQSRLAREDVFVFNRAEDRLAIGIIQALSENATERDLHSWISQLLNALEAASKANEEMSKAYKLDLGSGGSVVKEADKINSQSGRIEFLMNCWLESVCTAEIRVLGWLYKEFYGRPYTP
jgi:hypothetical protein